MKEHERQLLEARERNESLRLASLLPAGEYRKSNVLSLWKRVLRVFIAWLLAGLILLAIVFPWEEVKAQEILKVYARACVNEGCHYAPYLVRVTGELYDQTWMVPAGQDWQMLKSKSWDEETTVQVLCNQT